jgi:hypothetical protein
VCILFLVDITVVNNGVMTMGFEKSSQMLHHRHRTMLAAGTAHGQMQRFPASRSVFIRQKEQERFHQSHKLLPCLVVEHVAGYRFLQSGMWLQFRHPERIGKKTDIPDQIGLQVSVLETKGRQGNASLHGQSAEQIILMLSARSLMPRLSISWL